MVERKRERDDSVEEQLRDEKDARIRQLEEQLAAKDHLIEELLSAAKEERKRPRVVNNRYTVSNINVFGSESTSHIHEDDRLIDHPESAVSRYVQMKHVQSHDNRNILCPNKRESRYLVLESTSDGGKAWHYVNKNDVLTDLFEKNSVELEGYANESTGRGARFVRAMERVRESQDSDDKLFRDQLDRIHCVLIAPTADI